ncbi:MAG TPA: YbaN family protein [Longimicrobiales bacterium]
MAERTTIGGRPGEPHVRARPLWAAAAWLSTALALVGVLIPGVPTTPFVLLAAWAAARGSKRLHAWLHEHPRLGPALIAWEEQRAVSMRAKLAAAALLAASWTIMAMRGVSGGLLALTGALFLTVGTFVASRPTPRR